MKITVSQHDLSQGLAIVNHAVSNRSTLPILANILLSTDQGRLKLAATNMEMGIRFWIDADIEEEGQITVPAKLLTELVNSLASGQVELSLPEDGTLLAINSRGSHAHIQGVEASEFPAVPSADGEEPPITLDAALLKELITQVVFASANDDSRPVFTGILVEFGNAQMTMTAADSFRLASRGAPLPDLSSTQSPILVPAKSLKELARILPASDTIEMVTTPNQVLFHTDQMELVSRLVDETFPNYRAALPQQYTTRALVSPKEFAAAVKCVAPFAHENANIVRVTIEPSEDGDLGTITLVSDAEEIGTGTTTIAASVEGPVQEITLNVRYLIEVLAVLDVALVALEVKSAASPGVIRTVDSITYVYVIMPMTGKQ